MNKGCRTHGSLRHHSRSKSLTPHRRRRSSKSSSSSSSSRSRIPDLETLKKITVNIKANTNSDQSSLVRREILNPQNVTILRRPGEGSRPIFDRDELKKTSSTSERRIVRKSPSLSLSKSRSRSRSGSVNSSHCSRSRSRSRSTSRSRRRSRSRPRPRRRLIDTRYIKPARRSHSTRRQRSRSRDRTHHTYPRDHNDVFRGVGLVPQVPMMRPLRPVPFYGAAVPYVTPHGFLPPGVAAAYNNPRLRMPRIRPPRQNGPPRSA